jgi:23S rRNA G2069 N7-methylase RlmK/C1962 C5-methylase RlmI
MDAMKYVAYAAKHAEERFDLIVLDPPTFGAADRRRKVKAWSAVRDYPALLQSVARVLAPNGRIFAATNNRELATGRVFRSMVTNTLGAVRWESLPPWPPDLRERGRVAAALVTLRTS